MNLSMALKAEIMLAVQIITRHRAPRLVLLLAGSLMLATLGEEAPGSARPVLLIAGSLGAVAGSRLLARGGALAGARRAASSSLVPAVGRLAGALLLMGPVLLGVTAVVLGSGAVLARTVMVALVLGATTTALTMALSPAVGASAAAALGFVASLFGNVKPSTVAELLSAWPLLRTPAVLLWNALPLSWRAARWLGAGSDRGDPWVLLGWLLAALWVSAWVIERFPEDGGTRDSS